MSETRGGARPIAGMGEVRWERLLPDQLEARFAACPLLYLAYGLCEPHGPQNAVGLDALKAHAIAVEAARAHGGIVAPPDYWHVHELGESATWGHVVIGQARTWLTSMPPWQHFKNVCYHVRAADALGFHAVILLTGHYGPWQDLKTLVGLIQPQVGARLYALPDFEANVPGFDDDGAQADHAGKVETSLLWALHPECVDVSRIPPADAVGPHFAMGKDAAKANRKTGERMVADEVRWLGAKGKELLEEYHRDSPQPRLRTFDEVETLWAEIVRPRLESFNSMQEAPPDSEFAPVPPTSQWYANWSAPRRVP
jgi:creatinine amidohydrolase